MGRVIKTRSLQKVKIIDNHPCRTVTFAVFMEPSWDVRLRIPADRNPEQAQSSRAEAALPTGVPPLKARWGTENCPFTSCNFGDFTKETIGALH